MMMQEGRAYTVTVGFPGPDPVSVQELTPLTNWL